MDHLHYTLATESDAQILAEYRIAFLTELVGPQSPDVVEVLRQNLEKYFKRAIQAKTLFCGLARDGSTIVGTGAMVIREQPGSFRNPSGRTAYILNMYTIPAYRKHGIGNTVLKLLMKSATEMGIEMFELHATKEGEPVYQKNGFEKHHEPTYRKYTFRQ